MKWNLSRNGVAELAVFMPIISAAEIEVIDRSGQLVDWRHELPIICFGVPMEMLVMDDPEERKMLQHFQSKV